MNRKLLIAAYWLVAALTFAGAATLIFAWTPEEKTMHIIQKIFYFHLPLAINTFLACTVCAAAGIGYLVQRQAWWDDLAAAAAKVAVVLCTGVLLTGMLWGKGAWGIWWTWYSPRLVFSFMLWLLFVVYLIVRASVEGAQRRAVVGAVYALIAYLDIPLVYLSARLLPDLHPGNITLELSMKLTLALSFIPITLIALGLLAAQYRLHRLQRAARDEATAGFPVIEEPILEGGVA
jgi:heme exporter protein C